MVSKALQKASGVLFFICLLDKIVKKCYRL